MTIHDRPLPDEIPGPTDKYMAALTLGYQARHKELTGLDHADCAHVTTFDDGRDVCHGCIKVIDLDNIVAGCATRI